AAQGELAAPGQLLRHLDAVGEVATIWATVGLRARTCSATASAVNSLSPVKGGVTRGGEGSWPGRLSFSLSFSPDSPFWPFAGRAGGSRVAGREAFVSGRGGGSSPALSSGPSFPSGRQATWRKEETSTAEDCPAGTLNGATPACGSDRSSVT